MKEELSKFYILKKEFFFDKLNENSKDIYRSDTCTVYKKTDN